MNIEHQNTFVKFFRKLFPVMTARFPETCHNNLLPNSNDPDCGHGVGRRAREERFPFNRSESRESWMFCRDSAKTHTELREKPFPYSPDATASRGIPYPELFPGTLSR